MKECYSISVWRLQFYYSPVQLGLPFYFIFFLIRLRAKQKKKKKIPKERQKKIYINKYLYLGECAWSICLDWVVEKSIINQACYTRHWTMCPVVNRLYVVIRWVLGYGKKDTHTYPQKERKTCALELTHRSTQVRCEHLPIDHTFFPPHCVWSNHPVARVVIHDGAGLNSLEIHRSTILFFFSFEKLFLFLFFFFVKNVSISSCFSFLGTAIFVFNLFWVSAPCSWCLV